MTHIKAHVFTNGKHCVYALGQWELSGFIALHGWTVTNEMEGLRDSDRAEIKRLSELDSLAIPDRPSESVTWKQWHDYRRLSSEPCLTPDM